MHYLWGLRKLSEFSMSNTQRPACAEQDPILLHQRWLGSEKTEIIDLSKITMAAGLQVLDCSLLRNI